jgi:hypothetical protein
MFLKTTALGLTVISMNLLNADESSLEAHPNKMNFSLTQFGYEYNKRDSVHCGVDFKLTPIWNIKRENLKDSEYWSSAEGRIGYNFGVRENDALLLYGSFGYSHFNFLNQEGNLKQLAYFVIGSKFLHQFSPLFEMGLHVRAYRNVMMYYQIDGYKVAASGNTWKMEIGLPCIWHLGATRQWEISAEPYYIQLPTKMNSEYLGMRITYGYRF